MQKALNPGGLDISQDIPPIPQIPVGGHNGRLPVYMRPLPFQLGEEFRQPVLLLHLPDERNHLGRFRFSGQLFIINAQIKTENAQVIQIEALGHLPAEWARIGFGGYGRIPIGFLATDKFHTWTL